MATGHDAIVIGSGVGGLVAALALARRGRSVLVLEQHHTPGGYSQSFIREGRRFSPGVHYIGETHVGGSARRLFEGLGIAADLELTELNRDGYDHLIVAGERFDVPAGRRRFEERLLQRFPHDADGIARYFAVVDGILDGLSHADMRFGVRSTLRTVLGSSTLVRWGLRTLGDLLDHAISDPLLAAFLGARCGNDGLPPSRVSLPAHVRMIAHYFEGAAYPRGGGGAIVRALVRGLHRHGATVRTRADVTKILVEGGEARGVVLSTGEELRSREVISNVSPTGTFGTLLGDHPTREARRLSRTEYSVGTVSLFAALEGDVRGLGLDSGNYWLFRSADVEGTYRRAATEMPVGSADGVFVNLTSLKDPQRDPHRHALEAFCFVPYGPFARWKASPQEARGPDYERLKAHLGDMLLAVADRLAPGLRDMVKAHFVATPLTNEFYCRSPFGAGYGTAKTVWQVGPFSFSIRTSVPHLHLVGASTLSHGVTSVAASGLVAASNILGAPGFEALLDPPDGSLRVFPAEAPDTWLPERLHHPEEEG